MNASQPELCYRRAAVQQATSAGLVVILYDMLAGDLRKAIVALRKGRVQDRSHGLKHAFAVLEVLEGSLDMENGGTAAQRLAQFYGYLRRQMLSAQFDCNEKLLEQQIALILDVQNAWRQVDTAAARGELSRHAEASDIDAPQSTSPKTNARSQWSA